MQIQIDFWNVGQGDASSITLPDNEMILIDVGPKNSTLSQWLAKQHTKIKCIILTHNDSDHIGALNNILNLKNIVVENVFLLSDRPLPKLQTLFRVAIEKSQKKEIKLARLEIDTSPKILWSNGTLSLVLKHPNITGNLTQESCNDASAIISLRGVDNDLVIWGGDARFNRVTEVNDPNAEILFGPHHGAPQDKNKCNLKMDVSILKPKRCFISVGSNNNYHHPISRYIKALAQNNTYITCSQITQDCDRTKVLNKKHVVNTNGYYALPAPQGVFCRGHLRFYIDGENFIEDKYTAMHKQRIQSLHRPKCLKI